ncbi:MAG: glycosyltransferase family 2 protein [Bradyrhizobium sp.]|uniref:glycosyltransferase family 2 protein n=1 Tax=Bradyrhizobium sp. TaxID=376 RepID=UPI003D0C410A
MISIVTPWLAHAELIPAYEAAVSGAEVIIVEQEGESADALDAMCARLGGGSRVLHYPDRMGFSRATNAGLEVATGDVVVCLNNDIYGDAKRPNRWLRYVERDTPPGALSGPHVLPFPVDHDVLAYVDGWCVAARRETWDMLGGWDAEHYPFAYAEDVDVSTRARMLGCVLYQTAWPIHHIGHVTSSTTPGAFDHADAQREKVRERFRQWKAGTYSP